MRQPACRAGRLLMHSSVSSSLHASSQISSSCTAWQGCCAQTTQQSCHQRKACRAASSGGRITNSPTTESAFLCACSQLTLSAGQCGRINGWSAAAMPDTRRRLRRSSARRPPAGLRLAISRSTGCSRAPGCSGSSASESSPSSTGKPSKSDKVIQTTLSRGPSTDSEVRPLNRLLRPASSSRRWPWSSGRLAIARERRPRAPWCGSQVIESTLCHSLTVLMWALRPSSAVRLTGSTMLGRSCTPARRSVCRRLRCASEPYSSISGMDR